MKKLNVKKLNVLLLLIVFAGTSTLIGCKKKNDPKPATELIVKTWAATMVKEAGTTVYNPPSTTTKDYSKFKMSFTATAVALTEANGDVITGKWALTNNNTTLVLSSLNPQPTGVTGDLTYTNVAVTDSQLTLTRSSTNPKTGATSTDYVLN